MKTSSSTSLIRKSFYSALVFFGTIMVLSIGYATWNNTMGKVNTGNPLSASGWNALVDNITDLEGRWSRNGLAIGYTGGNVGIGTASPGAPLTVGDNSNAIGGGRIYVNRQNVSGAEGGEIGFANGDGTGPGFMIDNHGASDTEILRLLNENGQGITLNTSGNVGIGTSSPQGKLEAYTSATNRVVIGAPINAGWIWGTNTAGNLHIDADGTMSDGRIYLNWSSGKGVAIGNGAAAYGTISAATFNNASDRRLKKEIGLIIDPLKKVEALRGVTFQWRSDNRKDVGFIAQEVEKVIPELVTTDTQWYKGVRYSNITAVLVEAVKELSHKMDELFTKYIDQQKEINELKIRMEKLEQK